MDIGGNVRPLSREKQLYAGSLRAVELNVLMGHAPAKVDEKGRIKMPSTFRKLIEQKYGPVCFITSRPLDDCMAHVRAQGVEIIEGPVDRTGATSRLRSFYFRDPDLNLIEVANRVAAA